MAKLIDWKKLASAKGEVVSAGLGASIIELAVGASFVGKFIDTKEVAIGDKKPFTSLTFETEAGVQAIAGVNLVQQMRMINKGSIVRITKIKSKKTSTGNKCGQFTIEALTPNAINEKEREKIKKEIQEAVAKKNAKNKSAKKGKK